MLYKEIPFVRFTLPLVAGIILFSVTGGLPVFILLIYGVVCTFVTFFLASDRSRNILYGASILQLFIILGFANCTYRYSLVLSKKPESGLYTIRLDNYPSSREKSVKAEGTIITKKVSSRGKNKTKMIIYFPPESHVSDLKPGDLISLYITADTIKDFYMADSFDYSRYMMHRGYRYYSFASDYKYSEHRSMRIRHRALIIQKRLMNKYNNGLSNKRSIAIVSALTLGHREMIDDEIRETFNSAGISHIMAVSGLHVGILSIIVLRILKLFRIRSGGVRLTIAILAIWSFALISGLGPSVTRASLMFTFLYTGRLIDRHVNPVNSLLASAFLILIIDPFTIFNAGFQLSYSAVLAILLFFRRVNNLIPFSGHLLKKTWSLISVTLLAQAGTLPFVLYHFRTIPLLSIISNIFAIPLAFIILLTGFIYLIMPSSIFISDILAWAIEIETTLLYSITDLIASVNGTVLNIGAS